MEIELSWHILEKYSNLKFHENPSTGIRVVPCGWTDGRTEGHTDLKTLIVAFRNIVNAPKNEAVP